MQQQHQRDRNTRRVPGALPDPFAAAPETALVSHGIHSEELPIAGMTVGEVRRRLADRFDLDPDSEAFVDGNRVGDDHAIRAGQELLFGHRLGEKGSGPPPSLEIVGDQVVTESAEGTKTSMAVESFMAKAMPRWFAGSILPDDVKALFEWDRGAILVHQTPTRVHNCKWIAGDSVAGYGSSAKYTTVRIAMPYVIVLAVFIVGPRGRLALADSNECFFSNRPLRSVDDVLAYPALLNCSRFEDTENCPLSWICTQHLLRHTIDCEQDQSIRISRSVQALVTHLFHTGFNRSSETHELSSWFTETVNAKVDPRLASIETWQQATAEDPFFVEQVPWISTGLSLSQIAERICRLRELHCGGGAQRLQRIVANSALAAQPEQLEVPF